jgi:peptidoglycan/xylan/chitin deacetylase (PgdA/CDA1 family)
MRRLHLCLLAAVALLLLAVSPAGAAPLPSAWFYPQTGHTLTMGFARFVGTHGGTDLAGLPITDEIDEHGVEVQYFQHLRLEWRPDRPVGDQVVVGTLGLELGKAQPPVAPSASNPGSTFFPATGHTLADGFLAFYQAHDGAALLGAPITEELSEGGATVQYFSNAELVWRATSGVTLGDLGTLAATARGWKSTAPPLAPASAPAGAQQVTPGGPGPLPGQSFATGPASFGPGVIPATMQPGGRGHRVLPVLMYHHIGPWPSPYSVSTASFTAQLDWLQANGYQAISLHQLYAGLFGPAPLPDKPVVISIDDGYPDAATNARQILLQHHMTATFFIPTVQTPLSAATLRQMDGEGFDIEAHSRTHPDLTTLNDTAAWSEIDGSKQDLARILGHPVDLFAYPYGAVNAHVVALLQRAGYRGGILAGGGGAYSTATPYYEPRVLVDRGDDLANFIAKVTGRPYRNTLDVPGATSSGQGDGQPTPDYRPAPVSPAPTTGTGVGPAAGAPAPTNSGDGSGVSTGDGADDGGPPASGPASSPADTPGSDQSSEPSGHGELYV